MTSSTQASIRPAPGDPGGPAPAGHRAPAAPRSRRPVLRNRDFRLVFAAAGGSQLGTQVSYLAIPLVAVLALRASAAQVGLLGVLGTVAFLLIGLPAGAWVDRVRRRPTMIAADLLRAALLALVPVSWWLGFLSIYELYAVVLGVGIATVFFDVASLSYLPQLVSRDELLAANAGLVSLNAGCGIAGSGVGGVLVQLLAAPLAVAVDSVSYLWSAACVGRIRNREEKLADQAGLTVRRDVAEGVRYVLGEPVLRPIAVAGALTNLSIQLVVTMLPVLLVRQLGFSPGLLGVFFAVGGLGVLLGALSAHRIAARLGHGRTLWLGAILIAPFGFLVPLIGRGPWLWLAAGGWLMVTCKIGIDNVIQVSFRQRVTPGRLLGRMNATMRFLLTGAVTAGAALAGLLGQYIAVRAALWAAAIDLALVWVPIFFSPIRGMRDLPAPPDERRPR